MSVKVVLYNLECRNNKGGDGKDCNDEVDFPWQVYLIGVSLQLTDFFQTLEFIQDAHLFVDKLVFVVQIDNMS